MIADRTRAALAAMKAQGAVLGNRTNLAEAAAMGAAAQRGVAGGTARPSEPIDAGGANG